jgi:nucleoside-diphosphate-sugar epimerase
MDFLTDPFLIDPDQIHGPVLVTGAGGCIGAWTLAILVRSGAKAVAFDLRDDRRRPAMIMGDELAGELVWETGDIADAKGFEGIVERHGIRAIIHLAGLQVPFCKANPALGARVNVEGTINVLQAARNSDIKRTAYASSTAVHGMPPGGPKLATLYGAYKIANEYSAKMYWLDWGVPSVGIRPNVVYGAARDQGMTSMFTQGVAQAVLGAAFEVPYTGPISWLYAGECAAAFIAAISRDGEEAPVFDLNGSCQTVEDGLAMLEGLKPGHKITASGNPVPIPPDLSDAPIRALVGNYPSITPEEGIRQTFRAFEVLRDEGRLQATA